MNAANDLYKTLHIKNIKEEVKDFKTFSFAENLNYKAGQYLTFVYHLHNEEVRRSYSITSSPVLNEPLSIGVKRIENGFFSRRLIDSAKANDELISIGAGGLFVLPDDIKNYRQVFFFAAGSGITPIYSLLKTLLYAHPHINVVLIYSNASPEKTVFLNELKMFEKKFAAHFHAAFLFSNIVDLSKARLHRDLLFSFLNEFSVADFSDTLFYICGPQPYMRLCTFTLREKDVPLSNIKKEDFAINSISKRDAFPPDKVSRNALINLNGKKIEFSVEYPNSILQAAKRNNISLPYSCEAGRCASCIAKCIKGKVWHSYNEVLTEKELLKGLVLTCVGHPVDGDVELEIKTE
jgi:ring-1,2-phenylacetyl-CoA epoxidase subunit PaaE